MTSSATSAITTSVASLVPIWIRATRRIATVSILGLLAACGGGGGDSGASTNGSSVINVASSPSSSASSNTCDGNVATGDDYGKVEAANTAPPEPAI